MSRFSIGLTVVAVLLVASDSETLTNADEDITTRESLENASETVPRITTSASGAAGLENNSSEETDASPDANVPLAGHSEHGAAFNEGPRQNAYLMGGTGRVHLEVTTAHEEAQAFFDQGLGQLYGFWYYEAERSFRRVVTLDPDCAMGYWGLAQSNIDNRERGTAFIEQAHAKKEHVGQHEKMYIDALHEYLTDETKEKQRRQGYVKSLEKIIRKYPDDVEAKAMLAVHLWQSSKHGLPIVSHQAVDSLLEDIFRSVPDHPAHHFRIHLWDREEPAQALASAAVCGQSAPAIAHMWHMPGHIFSGLHRYHDAIFQQEASARADHAHMMRDGVLPDQIHNYAHNNEWLIRNLIHVGRAHDAIRLARNMIELPQHPKYNAYSNKDMCSCKYGRLRLLETLETFEMWDQLVDLGQSVYLPPTEVRKLQSQRLRALGVAHYRRGESEQLASCLRQLDDFVDEIQQETQQAEHKAEQELRKKWKQLKQAAQDRQRDEPDSEEPADDAGKGNNASDNRELVNAPGAATPADEPSQNANSSTDLAGRGAADNLSPAEECEQIKKARKQAKARASKGIAAVERAAAELRGLQWLARGETDEAIEQFAEADCPKARLAEYYFLCGDHEKAVDLLDKAVESGKNEVYPLVKQTDLLRRMGKRSESQAAFDKLRVVAGKADLDTPLLVRLEKLARALDYPADWRKPAEVADDVGNRPQLDALGPLEWAPAPAPPWSIFSRSGPKFSLSDYQGRPVVVIFYLGASCLHCVQQLHAFAPLQQEFESAGVSLVAISTESEQQLEASLDSYNAAGTFPIPLLANEDLSVFKTYRVYDDFENMPLHGTFLIDAQGLIRWRDISYEPFLDAKFLLQECQRLLATPQSEIE